MPERIRPDDMPDVIVEYLTDREFGKIRDLFVTLEPADIALLLGEIDESRLPILFRLLPKELAAETFVEMDSDEQELLINAFNEHELKEVIDELFVDDAVDLIEEMPANVVKRILRSTDSRTRNTINEILRYPKDSAGSIMTTEYVSLRPGMTVSDAFERIRRTGVDKETIYTCYVITTNRKLLGLVSVKELLLSQESTPIDSIMETNIISVETTEDKEDVANKFDKYDFISMPVVDKENRLVGIVTFDDAIDVIREEHSEDIQKMSAVSPSDENYFKIPIWKHAKNRIIWLLLLMLSATVTGTILNSYQAAFTAVPILVGFIPMLMGTGGNCGSQSSTMIIRGLALGEMRPKDIGKILFTELRVALISGITLAIVNSGRIFVMYRGDDPLFLSLTTGLSLIAIVALAQMLGALLPVLAKLCRLDPALMAQPLITTIMDAFSCFIFFNIALFIMTRGFV